MQARSEVDAGRARIFSGHARFCFRETPILSADSRRFAQILKWRALQRGQIRRAHVEPGVEAGVSF